MSDTRSTYLSKLLCHKNWLYESFIGYVFNNYFQSMKQCFLVHEAVKVYLFIYRRVFAYLLSKKSSFQNEIRKFLNEFLCQTYASLNAYISESIAAF